MIFSLHINLDQIQKFTRAESVSGPFRSENLHQHEKNECVKQCWYSRFFIAELTIEINTSFRGKFFILTSTVLVPTSALIRISSFLILSISVYLQLRRQ